MLGGVIRFGYVYFLLVLFCPHCYSEALKPPKSFPGLWIVLKWLFNLEEFLTESILKM